jgi:cephalosporin hydroxylase
MNEPERFAQEVAANIEGLSRDGDVQALSRIWAREVTRYKYTYNFTWMGRPVIQTPQDMIAMQEIIWDTQPDLIIETGIAHGGSLIYYASLLELLGGDRKVLGIDVDIRAHNRTEIEKHPMAKRIRMIEGSSVDESVARQVANAAVAKHRIMVVLDSNHTHAHVLQELRLYAPLVTKDCYLVVFDTLLEDMPDDLVQGRPWGKGNNPKTAVHDFLATNNRFEIDKRIQHKLLITVAPDGYLRCVKD